MKHNSKKNTLNDERTQYILSLSKTFIETSTNKDLTDILNSFNSATSVEKQIADLRNLSKYLNPSFDENTQLVITILSKLFVSASSKNPIKKSIIRIFANAQQLNSQISLELSKQLSELINEVFLVENNFQKANELVNAINESFDNCPCGVAAISGIISEVFEFLINRWKLLLKELNSVSSPIAVQELNIYIHNTSRALVAICKQCGLKSNFVNDLFKHCLILLNHSDICFDTKNNCGIIVVIAANFCTLNGYYILLQMCVNKNIEKWGIRSQDVMDDLATTCICSGILNVVKPEILCENNEIFNNSVIFVICNKLLELSKSSAAVNTSIILGVSRAVLLVSRSLGPLPISILLTILDQLLDYVQSHLEHNVDTVRHVARSILVNLVKLAVAHQENGNTSPLFAIVGSVLATSQYRISRYVSLTVISSEASCSLLLQTEPQLPSQLLQLSNDSSVTSYVMACYENLMRCHLREIDESTWLRLWVLPLTTKLTEDTNIDEKGYCLQSLLTVAIKLRPEILHSILSQWSTENEVQLSSLLKCALIARKIGASVSGKQEEEQWRLLLPFSVLETAMCHQNDEVRMSSLALIAEAHKSTEAFTNWELNFILSFLHYNVNTQFPATRQVILSLNKKIFTRLWESYCVITRNLVACKNHDLSKVNFLEDQKNMYEQFVFKVRDCLFDSLFPGANFNRRTVCLELLVLIEPMTIEIQKKIGLTANELWKDTDAAAILSCLDDSYESNKRLAVKLLSTCPPELLNLNDEKNTRTFIQSCLSFSASIRPASTITAAYMFEITVLSPVLREVLLSLTKLSDNKDYTTEYLMIKFLLTEIRSQLTVAKKSLLNAAGSEPIHGTMFCLRHLIEIYLSDLSGDHWSSLLNDIIETCLEVSATVCPVVNSSSPEGYLMDENIDGTIVTAQMLLVCCWRSVKEVSLLLGTITSKATITIENDGVGLINEQQMLAIGKHLTSLLTETKHRGAFEQAYVGFSRVCERLWKCRSSFLHRLPSQWLNEIITAVNDCDNDLCATRRSAGVPFMVQAIVASEPEVVSFHRCMTTLLQLADIMGDTKPETRTHAMNILRALFRHASLGETVVSYVAQGIIVAIRSYESKTWPERNSATLLFASLMTRIFGVQRSRDTERLSNRNRMSGKVFFMRYPSLNNFLLEQLKQKNALYPVLLLLARLYVTSQDDQQLAEFIPYIRACAADRIFKTRQLAAKSLASLQPINKQLSLLDDLFLQLKDVQKNKNHLHGILLQILHLLKVTNNVDKLLNIPTVVINTLWIMSESCALISALYLQIVLLLTTRYKSTQTDTIIWYKILDKLKNLDTLNTIIGTTTYVRAAICLQLHLLLNVLDIPTEKRCFQIYELIEKHLKSTNKDAREFILNILLCLLNDFDCWEIPEQERMLTDTISINTRTSLVSYLKTHVNKSFILALNSDNSLISKYVSVLSYFPEGLKLAYTENNDDIFTYYMKIYDIQYDDMTCFAVLNCLRTLLSIATNKEVQRLQHVFEFLFECSSPSCNVDCRQVVALILLDNYFLLAGDLKIVDGRLLCILWQTIMQLLEDSELLVRNTVSKLTSKLTRTSLPSIPEKSREILLEICVNSVKTISEDLSISLLLYWSIVDRNQIDIIDDIDGQVFEKGEMSTYIETMPLSKLAAKKLSSVMYSSKDMTNTILNRINDILKNDDILWGGTNTYRNYFLKILNQIQKKIKEVKFNSALDLRTYLSDDDSDDSDCKSLWNTLGSSLQYKILRTLESLLLL